MPPGKPLRHLLPLLAVLALTPVLVVAALLEIVPEVLRERWLAGTSTFAGIALAAAAGFSAAAVIAALYGMRLLASLAALRQAMHRLSRGDFSARAGSVRMPLGRRLGRTFDLMAARLGHEIAELRVGAELDRTMLGKFDREQVAAVLFARLPALIDCDVLALAVIADLDPRPEGQLLVGLAGRDPTASSVSSPARFDLSVAEIVEVKAIPGELLVRVPQQFPALAARLVDAGCRAVALFPLEWNGVRAGMLLIGSRDPAAFPAAALPAVRRIAARAADAVAGAAREERLFANAHIDPLTGLPGGLLLQDRIEREVSRAQRDRRELALLFVDLDRFRETRRTFGEAAAEQALKQVAARLRACLRESDTAARIEGDRFAVLLPDLASLHDAGTVADAVVRAVAQPLPVDGREVFLTASVGVAVFPFDGTEGADLLRHARMAASRAKSSGRNRHVYFEDRLNREAGDRSRSQGELRLAIERGEFALHFQPQVDLASGEVVGAEALLRWRHPERGTVLPREFLPAAEQSGLITRIGYWAVDEVGRTVDGWRTQGVEAPRVMVNVSLRQFRDPAFPDAVRFALQRWGMPRCALGFEIAESTLLDDPDTVVRALSQLKSLGTLVSIEDFGLRRSSLSLLTRLPYDLIKIDRAFVRDIARDTESASLVRAIIAIAHQFGKQVIAEGIEADTQREFLRHHGCDLGQGILLGRPLPATEFLSYLVSQRLLKSSAERAKRLVER